VWGGGARGNNKMGASQISLALRAVAGAIFTPFHFVSCRFGFKIVEPSGRRSERAPNRPLRRLHQMIMCFTQVFSVRGLSFLTNTPRAAFIFTLNTLSRLIISSSHLPAIRCGSRIGEPSGRNSGKVIPCCILRRHSCRRTPFRPSSTPSPIRGALRPRPRPLPSARPRETPVAAVEPFQVLAGSSRARSLRRAINLSTFPHPSYGRRRRHRRRRFLRLCLLPCGSRQSRSLQTFSIAHARGRETSIPLSSSTIRHRRFSSPSPLCKSRLRRLRRHSHFLFFAIRIPFYPISTFTARRAVAGLSPSSPLFLLPPFASVVKSV